MPGELVLNSLEIKHFKCFRHLRIDRLGRINLVVGKNNVGKSTLLEALRLYATAASPADLFDILASRNEVAKDDREAWIADIEFQSINSLFSGHPALPQVDATIEIGPAGSSERGLQIFRLSLFNLRQCTDNINLNFIASRFEEYHGFLVVKIGPGVQLFAPGGQTLYRIHQDPNAPAESRVRLVPTGMPLRRIPLYSVGSDGLEPEEIARLWDKVALSPLEQEVTTALKIVSAEVDRIALRIPEGPLRSGPTAPGSDDRVPYVKTTDFAVPVPLRALGDGVNRLFGLALALTSAKGGLLLVDEIENGIHYSVQADLWRLIFETAARLNVQVFATTHSYDCIKAFEEAARESEEEGVLVRLAQKGDRTLVGQFDERELEVAIEGDIEVR